MDFLLGIISKIPIIGKWAEIVSIGRTFKEAYKEFEEAEEMRKEAVEDSILTEAEAVDYTVAMIEVFETVLPKYAKYVDGPKGFLIAVKDATVIEYNLDTSKLIKVEFEG